MNCCDYQCDDGPNCPIHGAKVARIGRKDYAREELPPSYWRHQVRVLAGWLGLALLGWLVWAPLIYLLLRA
jgi:hypothetical protein